MEILAQVPIRRNHLRRLWYFLVGLLLVGLLNLAPAAYADTFQSYDLAWSGLSFDNDASAFGQITLDLTTLPNPSPSPDGYDLFSSIQSLSVTVIDSGSGDGTWTQSNLVPTSGLGTYTYWWTGGGALNLATELVGQSTVDGGPWGTPDGNSGDFNLFFNDGGPIGTYYFTLTTSDGTGDSLLLTEFSPSTPEPACWILVAPILAVLAGAVRRKLMQ
jgi:hypothetical protein